LVVRSLILAGGLDRIDPYAYLVGFFQRVRRHACSTMIGRALWRRRLPTVDLGSCGRSSDPRPAHLPTDPQTSETAVVLQLLHKEPFTSYGVQHLQQQRADQPFRSDRGSSGLRVQLLELPIHLARASETIALIGRSGCLGGTRASGDT